MKKSILFLTALLNNLNHNHITGNVSRGNVVIEK